MAYAAGPATQSASRPGVTAILCAMNVESVQFEQNLADKQVQEIRGQKFLTGALNGRRVVIAQTGIGKVNAAVTATLLIDRFQPQEVIFSGVAGGLSPNIQPGDIVIAAKTAQHDFGQVTDSGMQPGLVTEANSPASGTCFYPADASLLKLAEAAAKTVSLKVIATSKGPRQPAIHVGVVVTGDVFVASSKKKQDLYRTFQADAVEMEGAAVAQVCGKFHVPCLVIRSISDNADAAAGLDFPKFFRAAAVNSAALVTDLVGRLNTSAIPATAPTPAQ